MMHTITLFDTYTHTHTHMHTHTHTLTLTHTHTHTHTQGEHRCRRAGRLDIRPARSGGHADARARRRPRTVGPVRMAGVTSNSSLVSVHWYWSTGCS